MRINTLSLFALFLLAVIQPAASQNIVINEILTSNTSINTDEDGTYQDWVELRNNGPASVNLNGYGLSDDPAVPFKWVFPSVNVASGQYLLIYCSDKNRAIAGSPLHTNFKISSSGEQITLTRSNGTVADMVPPVVLQQNMSYGRSPNGTGSFIYFTQVTPNAANGSSGYNGFLNPPTFSQNSGFYTSAFSLTISTSDPGATIIYTVDGSEPDPANLSGTTYQYKNSYPEVPGQPFGPLLNKSFKSFQYSSPISIVDRSTQPNKISTISSTYSFDPNYYIPDNLIFKGTVVRAKVVRSGSLPSETVSRTYFVTPLGASRFTIPVISLSFSENKFFDYNQGIYVAGVDFDNWRVAHPSLNPRGREVGNYYRRGIENERRAAMSYFVNGTEVINQDVGLRIHGASTRRYESKALNVYARSDYGDDNLSYQFFPDLSDNSFETMLLSSSGSDFRNTMFRDALVQRIAKELHVENENYQPTVTFLNGEYWGILNIRERYDNEYFKRVYNIDDVDLLENEGVEAEEGDINHYQSMINFIENNSLAVPANYTYLKTQMDPDSFTDCFITSIFFDNSDWPGNNITFWRKKTATYEPNAPYGHDGRWRWAFHDLDDTFSFGTDDFTHDNLDSATSTEDVWPHPAWSTLILRKLLENPSYKNDFINRFADLMNTSFLSSRIISIMNSMKGGIAAEMAEHINRWSIPGDMESWEYFLQYQTDFANQRPAYQRDHIRQKFGIASNINATLNVSGASHGHIKINTIDIAQGTPGISANPYPWTGIYFSGIPVKLKAIPNPGYTFSHWQGASNSTDPEITITSNSNFSITAVFVQTEPVEISEPVYFWMMDGSIANNTPLLSLNSTYQLNPVTSISYSSSLTGYPFNSSSPFWRKASMERRNNPTPINYRPAANGNAVYNASTMKGLQVLQPFQSGGLENTMVFNLPTTGFKNIIFTSAVVDEGAATGLLIDYSVTPGAPTWITTGLASSTFALTNAYQLLSVDFTSITSVNNNPNFKVRIRFTGPNMTVDNGDRVTFNNIALDGVRMPLTYPTPNVYTAGIAIAPLTPAVSGGTVLSFSVSPALPAGLSLNTTTGVISGTPTVQSPAANYTVTATYSGGNATFNVSIAVNPAAPSGLSYNSPNMFTSGVSIGNLIPSISGGAATYTIAPALPTGLVLNPSTGIISGTPSQIAATATYTVTATNVSGSTTFGIVITINDAAPASLSYSSPNIFTLNSPISNLNPTVSGGTVTSYSVSPGLPVGLTLDTATGVISGTPTAITSAANYTITASNSGGAVTFNINIAVKDTPPSGLSYLSPNTFTAGTLITPLTPTVSGGAVTSYSVSPSLPAGLVLDTATGIFSGTPTNPVTTATYTVTASNSGGTATFNVVITINSSAPGTITYPSPNVFTVGTAISDLTPVIIGGTPSNYSVSPALPAGLSLNTTTGVISGTPTTVSASASYVVTATNSGGSTTFTIGITVNNIPPSGLSYATPNVLTIGAPFSISPSISGGAATNYSVAPALPAGLSINPSTGVISGTPTAIFATSSYLITATNSGGSTNFTISITVNDIAPAGLSYSTPNVYTLGAPITPLQPDISGGAALSYSVSPPLPAGLQLDTNTGTISGTPSVLSATTNYLVTATNTGGSTSFTISIAVNPVAPNGLTYNSPNLFTVGVPISPLTPVFSGSGCTFTVSPALPGGLSIDFDSGVISGTPAAITATTGYTVTASNESGDSSFTITITINDNAPTGLSYLTPNVFTVGQAISPLQPTVSGGAVTNFTVSPSLPSGLLLNAATGEITGTPTSVDPITSYVVTAHNSGGTSTFAIQITVNEMAPAGLSYTSPVSLTVGVGMTPLQPVISGGPVAAYLVSPSLPSGISIDATTGIISGTPVTISSPSDYTITASNSGGSTSFVLNLAVLDAAPTSLTYNTPNIFTAGIAISPLSPTVTGTVSSFSISPTLPAGLNLNTATGVISGTPSAPMAQTSFSISASNSGGSVSFSISIQINEHAPESLSYNSPNVFTTGVAITPLQPTITGTVSGYSVSPALPDGLVLDPVTGIISGTPTIAAGTASYSVTAANSGGTSSFNVVITVNESAPSGLDYNSPNVFTIGTAIIPLTPTVSGVSQEYHVSPALPLGLVLDTSTGVISGTPTVVSAPVNYTITATNSGGSTSFALSIAINDVAPSQLLYNTPNVFTINVEIASLQPTVAGNVSGFTVSPNLPDGLSFDSSTGIISGTPTVVSAPTVYHVSASNSGGSASFDVEISVVQPAPSALSYPTPNVLIVGNEISPLQPSVSGTVSTYSISPGLPAGLNIDSASGIISGTPAVISPVTVYTVTASNTGGSATFDLQIAVNEAAPSGLSYPTPLVTTVNVPITPLTPTVNGNVSGYSIFPPLPAGLSFNTTTGVISGTPTIIQVTSHTITATNSGGEDTFDVAIDVNDVAPSGLSYSSPNNYSVGSAISPLTPTVSGNIVLYSVLPELPAGLHINSVTGVISGTPLIATATAIYTVKAENSGGFSTFGVEITVHAPAPSGLAYNFSNVFTVGEAIAPLNPTVNGDVTLYTISPLLPVGLSIDATTGVISGTPTAESPELSYTVTASNEYGSSSFVLVITVNDAAPIGLSYPSPVVYTIGDAVSIAPTVTGNVTNYSVSPALPLGLSIDASTGIISGTATVVSPTATYTITASNSGGIATFDLVLTIHDPAPSALAYNSPNVFTVGSSIAALSPTVTGIVTGYSVSPALPSGISIDAMSGVISGTPTAVSPTSSYTVTASNDYGSTSFALAITVNDPAPIGLSYPSPAVYTIGDVVSIAPTVTGNVSAYSVSPALPSGLSIDAFTGVISGTATVVSPTATYTITASNSGGIATFDLVLTIHDPVPSGLVYSSPNVFTVGSSISALSPTVSGIVTNYSVSPALPSGLSIDAMSGVISGTPTAVSPESSYTVTASNDYGSTSFVVVITVNDAAPIGLSYPSPVVYTIGDVVSIAPTVTGNVSAYSVSPALPSGLSIDAFTGVISGTATVVSPIATYTITASNSGGIATFDLVLTIHDPAPSALAYNSPNVFTVGSSIAALSPTVSGIVTNYSVSPALPSGISIDATTGIISGTPTAVSPTSSYTVTASNNYGSTSFVVVITVNDAAPIGLSYPSPVVYTIGDAVSIAPTVTGNVTNYSVSPALPSGLSIDASSGIISGTATVVSPSATYTITASNSGGITTFDLVLTVHDPAPSELAYNYSNVFTVGTPISALNPTVSGNELVFTISPALPDGLSIDTVTGVISGTPAAVHITSTFTVTASNAYGSTTFDLVITVNDIAPSNLSYPSPLVIAVGNNVSISPTVTGNIISYSIQPQLPPGLIFNSSTGTITGAATGVSDSSTYTVTCYNSGGNTSFELIISVVPAAPVDLSYNTPNVFTTGTAITPLSPSVTGDVTLYEIQPALPTGLEIDPQTGVISGTPLASSESATYVVTASNVSGSVSFEIEIRVNDPMGIDQNNGVRIKLYPNPFVDTINISGLDSEAGFKLYSLTGKLVQTGTSEAGKIHLNEIAAGTYMLHLEYHGRIYIRKVIRK